MFTRMGEGRVYRSGVRRPAFGGGRWRGGGGGGRGVAGPVRRPAACGGGCAGTGLRQENAVGGDHVRLLSLVDVFEPLSWEEIEKINWRNLNTKVEAGEVFYTPMDLSETLFVLQSGRVRIYRALPEGRELTLAVFEGGTVFGEMALTGQRLRASYAQAMEESEISAMCRADVERLALDKPAVGLQLVHLLSERLAAYEARMEGLGLKEVPARLADLILELVETQGIRTRDGYKIPTR